MPMLPDGTRLPYPPRPPITPPRPPIGGNRPPGLRRTNSNMDMPFTEFGTTPVPMPEFPSPEGYDFAPTAGGSRPFNPDTGMPWSYSTPEGQRIPDGFLDEFQGFGRPNPQNLDDFLPEFQGYGKPNRKGSRRPSSASGNRMNNELLATLQALLGRIGGR